MKRMWTDLSTPVKERIYENPAVQKAEELMEAAYDALINDGYHYVDAEHFLYQSLGNHASHKRLLNGMRLHKEGKIPQ